jgi:hypothetical protein
MAQFLFEGKYKADKSHVLVKLFLIHFVDESSVHIIYSPHLDLSGYGNSLEEAKSSFDISLDDFIDYTVKKKTIGKVLTELGWEIKGKAKKPQKVIAPSITSIIQKNDYVSEMFDKYPANTFHQDIGIPVSV